MKIYGEPGCKELHPESIGGVNMLIDKMDNVIVDCRILVKNCLNCDEINCNKKNDNMNFLEKNTLK